jgi:hypothetical protein
MGKVSDLLMTLLHLLTLVSIDKSLYLLSYVQFQRRIAFTCAKLLRNLASAEYKLIGMFICTCCPTACC